MHDLIATAICYITTCIVAHCFCFTTINGNLFVLLLLFLRIMSCYCPFYYYNATILLLKLLILLVYCWYCYTVAGGCEMRRLLFLLSLYHITALSPPLTSTVNYYFHHHYKFGHFCLSLFLLLLLLLLILLPVVMVMIMLVFL
jgi:hypothetical protein